MAKQKKDVSEEFDVPANTDSTPAVPPATQPPHSTPPDAGSAVPDGKKPAPEKPAEKPKVDPVNRMHVPAMSHASLRTQFALQASHAREQRLLALSRQNPDIKGLLEENKNLKARLAELEKVQEK